MQKRTVLLLRCTQRRVSERMIAELYVPRSVEERLCRVV